MKKKQTVEELNTNREKSLDEIKLEKESQEVTQKIEQILKENDFALQTFIEPVVIAGVISRFEPRVRLIKKAADVEKPE